MIRLMGQRSFVVPGWQLQFDVNFSDHWDSEDHIFCSSVIFHGASVLLLPVAELAEVRDL